MVAYIEQMLGYAECPIAVVVVVLFFLEIIYFSDLLGKRQRAFNWIGMIMLFLYTIGWPSEFMWIRVLLTIFPLIFNFSDIFHISGKKDAGFLWANIVETVFITLLFVANGIVVLVPLFS